MSPQFPPLRALDPIALDPRGQRPQAPHPAPPRVGSRFLVARAVVTLAGVGGFLGLLVAAVHAPPAREGLRIAAFAWFMAFGVARIILDLLATRVSRRRPEALVAIDRAGERGRRVGAGQG